MILFTIADTVWKLLSFLPFRVLYVLSDVLIYPILYHVIRYRVKLVRRNLAASFPEKSQTELRRIERWFYRYMADLVVEILKMRSMPKEEMRRRMVFEDAELLSLAARRCGRAFIHLGHFGNWEWVASLSQWIDADMHGAQVYHPLRNKFWNERFVEIRSQYGGENIPMRLTLRRLLQLHQERQPLIIGFIADQVPKVAAMRYFVPSFLHHPDTPVYSGAEQIARKLPAEHFYLRMERVGRGYYRAQLIPMHAVEAKPGDLGVDGEQYPYTRHFFEQLEAQIKEMPWMWLWTHNRWKRTRETWEQTNRKK